MWEGRVRDRRLLTERIKSKLDLLVTCRVLEELITRHATFEVRSFE